MTPPASSYCILFINIYKQLDLIIPLLSYEVATYLYILDIVRVPAIYKVRTCMYGIPCINDILVWRTLQVLYSFAQLPVAISSVTFWHFFPFCSDGQSKGANSDRIKKTFFDHPFCFFVTEKTSQTREEIRDDVDSSCQGGGHGTGGKRWNAKQGMKTEEITPPPPRQKQTARLRRIRQTPDVTSSLHARISRRSSDRTLSRGIPCLTHSEPCLSPDPPSPPEVRVICSRVRMRAPQERPRSTGGVSRCRRRARGAVAAAELLIALEDSLPCK